MSGEGPSGELQPTASGPEAHRAVFDAVERAQRAIAAGESGAPAWTRSHRRRVLVVGTITFAPSGAEVQEASMRSTFASRIAGFGIFTGISALWGAFQIHDDEMWGPALLLGLVLLGVGLAAARAVQRTDRARTAPDVVHAGVYLTPDGILVRHAGELDDHHRFVPRDEIRDVGLVRGNRGRTSTIVEHRGRGGVERKTSLGGDDLVGLVRAWMDRT